MAVCIMVNGKKEDVMETVCSNGQTVQNMKDNSWLTNVMASGYLNMLMVPNTVVNGRKILNLAKENSLGLIIVFMKVLTNLINKVVKEHLYGQTNQNILGNGLKVSNMVLAFSFMTMAALTKETGRTTKEMEKAK